MLFAPLVVWAEIGDACHNGQLAFRSM